METYGIKTGSSFIGKKIQSIEVQTTHGIKKIPGDYLQKWLVLICHPGDFNLTCLEEFYAFAKKDEEFKKLNTELIGLSIDEAVCKAKCVQWIKQRLKMKISFPIIIDDIEPVTGIHEMSYPSKTTHAISIVDPEAFIRLIIYYPKNIDMQVDNILGTIKALQISDSNIHMKDSQLIK